MHKIDKKRFYNDQKITKSLRQDALQNFEMPDNRSIYVKNIRKPCSESRVLQ